MNVMQSRRVVLALSLLLAGCGGGSSRGTPSNNPAPTLVAVSFIGAGAAPVAGDALRLVMSEPISLTTNLLDDADLQLSGGSLGTVAAAPTLVSARVLQVTLGAGVTLVAGGSNPTTITFGTANDAVTDTTGQLAVPDTPRPLQKGDGDAPTVTGLTLSGVHPVLNGTGAAGGTLQVATTGFSIDLTYADPSSAVDPALTTITADVPVLVNGANLVAGENLRDSLTTASATPTSASYTVPAGVTFPVGAVRLSCYVVDTSGQLSGVRSFAFLVRQLTTDLQPFEKNVNPSQVWFLDTSRDLESMSVNLANSITPVEVTAGPNGRSDLEDVFQVLGLWIASPVPVGAKNSNQAVMDLFRTRLETELTGFYAGVNVRFTFTAPGTFPANTQVIPYNSFGFSQMCIAGSATATGNTGVGGLAIFDPHNEVHENDCLTDFNGRRLGVFLHTMANLGFQSGPSTAFAVTFNPFAPTRIGGGSGTPIGTHPDNQDPGRLLGSVTDQRASDMARAINDLARLTAVIVAHECGHSMGLVQDLAMPAGLYGNSPAFPGSSGGHIAMPNSVFGGASFNIMTPQIDYTGALDLGTRFNTLNLAYLRESVIYDNN